MKKIYLDIGEAIYHTVEVESLGYSKLFDDYIMYYHDLVDGNFYYVYLTMEDNKFYCKEADDKSEKNIAQLILDKLIKRVDVSILPPYVKSLKYKDVDFDDAYFVRDKKNEYCPIIKINEYVELISYDDSAENMKYKVKFGENLDKIAAKFNVSKSFIMKENGISEVKFNDIIDIPTGINYYYFRVIYSLPNKDSFDYDLIPIEKSNKPLKKNIIASHITDKDIIDLIIQNNVNKLDDTKDNSSECLNLELLSSNDIRVDIEKERQLVNTMKKSLVGKNKVVDTVYLTKYARKILNSKNPKEEARKFAKIINNEYPIYLQLKKELYNKYNLSLSYDNNLIEEKKNKTK